MMTTTDSTGTTIHDHRFETHPTVLDGDRVVEKTASGTNRSELRREASVLTQMDSRFAIKFIELRERDDETVMVTHDAGARTLANCSKLSESELRLALVDCVNAVFELRRLGWEHSSLLPEHVIVGARGRVKICSFGAAKHVSSISAGDQRPQISPDVSALIDLVVSVAHQDLSDANWFERRRRSRFNKQIEAVAANARTTLELGGNVDRVLKTMARSITTPEAVISSSPSPSRTSNLAQLRERAKRPQREPIPPLVGRVAQITGVSLAIFAIAAAIPALRNHSSEAVASTGLQTGAAVAARTRKASSPEAEAARVATPNPEPSNIISHGTTLYSIGTADDVTLTGDWFCSGTEQLILLRPSTGELFVFDTWATEQSPTTGRLATTMAGAIALTKADTECGPPSVTTSDGDSVVLDSNTLMNNALVGTRP